MAHDFIDELGAFHAKKRVSPGVENNPDSPLTALIAQLIQEAEYKLSTVTANGSNSFGRTFNGRTLGIGEQGQIDSLWSHWNGRLTALRQVRDEIEALAARLPPEEKK